MFHWTQFSLKVSKFTFFSPIGVQTFSKTNKVWIHVFKKNEAVSSCFWRNSVTEDERKQKMSEGPKSDFFSYKITHID